MRRFLMVAALVALTTGCSDLRERFSSQAGLAAKAGSAELTSERLAQILTSGKAVKPNAEAAEFVTGVWIDYSLFAQAVARGDSLTDSTTMSAAMWPDIAELRTTRWHDTLLAQRVKVGPRTADSLYGGNDVRVFQHVLFRVAPTASAAERAQARRQAEAVLAQARGGADFGALASARSQDPSSAADSGFLPAAPKGQWVAPFDSAGWLLQPGQLSGVVETPFGYHVLRRPPADAVRERLVSFLHQSQAQRLDSLYMDSLAIKNELEIEDDAAATMRTAVADMERHKNSSKTIVDFEGGGLTVKEFLRWVRALPPQYRQQVKTAPDDQLTQFARVLSQNVLLVRQADSAKVALTPTEWQGMRQMFRGQLDSLKMEMGLGGDVTDSSVSEAQRLKVAQMKVDQFFDRLLQGQLRLRPMPSALAQHLREKYDYRLYPAGLARAVQLGQARYDSLNPGQPQGQGAPGQPGQPGAPGQPPVIQPAPGPNPGAPNPAAPGQPAPNEAAPNPSR